MLYAQKHKATAQHFPAVRRTNLVGLETEVLWDCLVPQ